MPERTKLKPREAEHALTSRTIGMPLVERVAVIRSQSASRITWHAHPRFEALFLLEGATTYEFADGETIELPGDHFLIVPPGRRHRGLYDVRNPVRLCGVMFDPRGKRAAWRTPFTQADLRRLHRQFERASPAARRLSPELRRLVRTLNHQTATFEPGDATTAAACRLTLCATLLEAGRQLTLPPTQTSLRAVQDAVDFMESRLSEPLTMNDVARAARCSRARLFHNFKAATGMSPNDYLQRLRVQQAREALDATDDSITAIALRHGFSTSQYFSNVFRKYIGATPSAFRLRER
jgi:AraC-like DNA-binding protein/quercetin dioxygenase-like cupin family protein